MSGGTARRDTAGSSEGAIVGGGGGAEAACISGGDPVYASGALRSVVKRSKSQEQDSRQQSLITMFAALSYSTRLNTDLCSTYHSTSYLQASVLPSRGIVHLRPRVVLPSIVESDSSGRTQGRHRSDKDDHLPEPEPTPGSTVAQSKPRECRQSVCVEGGERGGGLKEEF